MYTMKVTGRMYDDFISAMVIEARLKTVLCEVTGGSAAVRRRGNVVTVTIPGRFDSDDIIGLKEVIAAECELIADVAFDGVTA